MYLLRLNRKGDVYKDDDGVTGVVEFQSVLTAKNLGPAALKWIALIYDYDSPYRHFTESERIKAVSLDLYGNVKWKEEKREEIKAAVVKYRQLQFDPLDEQLLAFNNKIDQFTTYMNNMPITQDTAQEIREGKITRKEGVALVKKYDGEFPKKNYKKFLDYCSLDKESFNKIIDSWRSEHIWYKDNNDNWKLKQPIWK